MKNVLFVCSANKERSKTAEDYFSGFYPNINFNSCDTNIKLCQKEGTHALTESWLEWADAIFVMERKHAKLVKQYSPLKTGSKMIILGIADVYTYYQKELIAVLVNKTSGYFNNDPL